jgi:DNA-binding NarL/FixJ family response regulator
MNPRGDPAWPGAGARARGRLRILVVVSHRLFGATLARLLAEPPLMAEVEALTDVEAANQRLEGAGVELVICELTASTVETTRSLQQRSLEKGVPVVLLADADEEGLLLDAANAGAGGFFTNDCPPQEFFAGLELVLEGQQAVGRRLIPGMLARLTRARKTVRS